jgi:hypothetical protein
MAGRQTTKLERHEKENADADLMRASLREDYLKASSRRL